MVQEVSVVPFRVRVKNNRLGVTVGLVKSKHKNISLTETLFKWIFHDFFLFQIFINETVVGFLRETLVSHIVLLKWSLSGRVHASTGYLNVLQPEISGLRRYKWSKIVQTGSKPILQPLFVSKFTTNRHLLMQTILNKFI